MALSNLNKEMLLMNTSCQVVDEGWPEAWYMVEDDKVESQKCENRLTPNKPVNVKDMRALGLNYWKMDAENYKYPVKAIPWDPQEATDPRLKALRDDRGYSYADVLTIHPDFLPGFEGLVKNFFTEHIHDAEEIRYILGGSGFFDVRDPNDKWVRVHVKKGDLMTLPEGIYHRFTCDETNFIHAMRLFIGVPCWTPINRFTTDTDNHASRKKYVCLYCMPQELLDAEEKEEEEEEEKKRMNGKKRMSGKEEGGNDTKIKKEGK